MLLSCVCKNCFQYISNFYCVITHADDSCMCRVVSGICVFVGLSVCLSVFPHNIMKLDTDIFHDESW